jgi:ABC-type branched-subunit amino acid transport system substrate-binding protein
MTGQVARPMTAYKITGKSFIAAVIASLLLAACASSPTAPQSGGTAQNAAQTAPVIPIIPLDLSGYPPPPPRPDNAVVIALVLPFGDSRSSIRDLSRALQNAAQLALFDLDRRDIVLSLHDTKGTQDGAKEAVKQALAAKADLIVGPLFSTSVAAIAPMLAGRDVPALALSNDRSVKGDNIWLLGFLPEDNIDRIVTESISQGLTRFGALLPEGAFGERVHDSLQTQIALYGGDLVQTEFYPADPRGMFAPVQALAQFERRKKAHEAEMARLTNEARALAPPDTPDEDLFTVLRDIAPELTSAHEALKRSETLGDIPYDVVFMPEGGLALRSLAPLLPYFDIDPRLVKFVGTGLWDDPSLTKEPPLHGGWYPAPENGVWQRFVRRFKRAYGQEPPRLASIAYDAMGLAAELSRIAPAKPFTRNLLTDPNGFAGIDGILRLTPDGLGERGLAVHEITARGSRVINAAPASFVEHDRRRQAALMLASRLREAAPPINDAVLAGDAPETGIEDTPASQQ